MLDKRNLHQELQEMCDCQKDSDPLREMSLIDQEEDKPQAAVKWLALTLLHGINANAKKVELTQAAGGPARAMVKYRESELPPLSPELAGEIFAGLKDLTQFEHKKAKLPLSLGIGNDSLMLELKVQQDKAGGLEASIKFPKL